MTIPTTPFAGSGVRAPNPPNQVSVPNPPTTADYKNFNLGDEWLDTSSNDWYKLASVAGGVALWVRTGGTPGDISQITTDSGVVTPVAGNVNFTGGTGMNITGSGSTATFNATGGGLKWNLVTTTPTALVRNNGYLANLGSLITFTLPVSPTVGDIITVTGVLTSGSWTITQGADDRISIGIRSSSLGAGGSISSTFFRDSVTLVCISGTAGNVGWQGISSIGNITFV